MVRDAIAGYFGGPLVPGEDYYRPSPVARVGTVYRAHPKRMPQTDFDWRSKIGESAGAVLVVQIATQTEKRLALGGARDGWKTVHYEAILHIYHLSKASHAEQAQTDLDLLLDDLMAYFRLDRSLGTGGTILEAGEGGSEVVISFGEPKTEAEQTESYAGMHFRVTEHVRG